jgi:hypothetical protein
MTERRRYQAECLCVCVCVCVYWVILHSEQVYELILFNPFFPRNPELLFSGKLKK